MADNELIISMQDEIRFFRSDTVPRLHQKIEENYNKIEAKFDKMNDNIISHIKQLNINGIMDKITTLDKSHEVTLEKIRLLYWLLGVVVVAGIGSFMTWVFKN